MDVITDWLRSGKPFVFYRLPGEQTCHGIRSDLSSLQYSEDVSLLNHASGYVFAPFQSGKGHPLCLLPADEEVCFVLSRRRDDVVEAPAPVPSVGPVCETPSAEYAGIFSRFSAALVSGEYSKLVLSRRWSAECPPGFSLAEAFAVACQRYVHSYVYLLYIPHIGYWLGATPEILLSGCGNDYKTVALAGTQSLDRGHVSVEWSEKNIREQRYVSDYICDCLRKRGIEPSVEGPLTVTAGALAHLKTEIRFTWDAAGHIGDLLKELHPTPAVCGLPEKEACRFICENEGYDRGYYAGFLGRSDAFGRTDLYVNLRCMQVDEGKENLCLFAGGGLLAASRCADEWMETERKLQTMKYVIQKSEAHVFG